MERWSGEGGDGAAKGGDGAAEGGGGAVEGTKNSRRLQAGLFTCNHREGVSLF